MEWEVESDRFEWVPETDCVRWLGPHSGEYGIINYHGRTMYVHVLSYLLFRGPIRAGMEVDHVLDYNCRFKDCLNPAHLEAVTHKQNMARIRKLDVSTLRVFPDAATDDLL